MRKLGLKDAWALARIIAKADIKDDIVKFAGEIHSRQNSGEKVNIEEIGLEFFVAILCSVSSEEVEKQFYKLFADIKGVSAEEISTIDFKTLKNDIQKIIEENDLKNFFQSLSGLISKS